MSDDYIVCRCGARFTNNDEGKQLYDRHQAWCGKQGMMASENRRAAKRQDRHKEE